RFRSRLAQRLPAGKVGTDLQQRASLVDAGFFDQCGLIRARLRQDKRPAVARRAPSHRERPANRTQLAGERELPGEFVFREPVDLELARGGEDTERNGQIEPAALLGEL